MVGHHHMRACADAQVIHRHPLYLQGAYFLHEHLRVYHHPAGDDVHDLRAENAGGHQMQFELMPIEANGMTGVTATTIAHHHIGILRQAVHHFAFRLVTPLGTDHNNYWHAAVNGGSRFPPFRCPRQQGWSKTIG